MLYDDDKATITAMDLYLDTCISSWHFIARIRVIIATVTYICAAGVSVYVHVVSVRRHFVTTTTMISADNGSDDASLPRPITRQSPLIPPFRLQRHAYT